MDDGVPYWFLVRSAPVDAFHEEAQVAMYALHVIFMLFVDSLDALLTAVLYVTAIHCSAICTTRSTLSAVTLHVSSCFIARYTPMTGKEGSSSMLASVSARRVVLDDDGPLLGDPLGAYTVLCLYKRTVSYSTENLQSAVKSSMMNQVPEGISQEASRASKEDASTQPSCQASIQPPLEAIATMTRVGVQDTLRCTWMALGPLSAHLVCEVPCRNELAFRT